MIFPTDADDGGSIRLGGSWTAGRRDDERGGLLGHGATMAVGVYGRRGCCRKKVDECKMLAADACGSCTDLMGEPKSTLVDRFGKADNVPCDKVGSKAERRQVAAAPAAAASVAPLPLSPSQSPNRRTRQRIRPTSATRPARPPRLVGQPRVSIPR